MSPTSVIPDKYLRIYLSDHRSAAAGGIRLARRCRGNNVGSELGRFLDTLVDEVSQDVATLDQIMEEVGTRRNPVKHVLVVIGERLARLKPNGRLRGYSPLSRVIELEGLIAGVHAKQRLWHGVGAGRHGIDSDLLDEMIERADRQLNRLEAFHHTATSEAFDRSSRT
ncbi:MAG: hypothetical protein ABJH68_07045 [Ilumatobacter sp.]|uniref:hypothetical protein n=1 Tax=Ilumatobacter sp. TaxID=1967498 RepID=UPI0032991CE7